MDASQYLYTECSTFVYSPNSISSQINFTRTLLKLPTFLSRSYTLRKNILSTERQAPQYFLPKHKTSNNAPTLEQFTLQKSHVRLPGVATALGTRRSAHACGSRMKIKNKASRERRERPGSRPPGPGSARWLVTPCKRASSARFLLSLAARRMR